MSRMEPRSIKSAQTTSNTKTLHRHHEKAAWLKIYDDEEKEEKKEDNGRKMIKGVYKRNSHDTAHRKTDDRPVTSRDIYSHDFYERSSSTRPKSVTERGRTSKNENGLESDIKKSHRSGSSNRDSNLDLDLDLDFADKIKAFRSLIKTNPKIDSDDDHVKPRAGSSDATQHRGHIKFNAKSLEGRASAPNEFQLTYEQDKYLMMNARNYRGSGMSSDSDRKRYSGAHLDTENGIYDTENNRSSEMLHNKPYTTKVIKRPTDYLDTENHKVPPNITSILKRQRSYQTGNDINHDKYSHIKDATDNEINSFEKDGLSSRRHRDTTSSAQSHRSSSSLAATVRPTSVAEINQEHHSSRSTLTRPHSAAPQSTSVGISGRVDSNVGSLTPSSYSNKKDSAASLQTHLNVLGASLSSLSTILNGGDSSDNTLEHNDIGRRIDSTYSIVSTGRSGRTDHSTRVADSLRRGARPASALNAVEHDFAASPPSEFSGASIPTSSLRGSVSYSAYKSEISRPRSDDYFVLERLRRQNVPSSPRVKQTNVKGDDSILSPRDENSRLYSDLSVAQNGRISNSSRLEYSRTPDSDSEFVQNGSSHEVLSKQNLRHYVRYISRHTDNLADYSSKEKGAKQIDRESNDSRYMSSRNSSQNSREIHTQTPHSDYSDDDTLVNHDSEALSSQRELRVNGVDDHYSKSSPNRPKIISRHQVATTGHSHRNDSRHSNGRDSRSSPLVENQTNSQFKTSQTGAREGYSSAQTKTQPVEKTRVIRRPHHSPIRDSGKEREKDTITRKPPRSVSGRSQTVLGLSASKDSSKKYAILPSKYNTNTKGSTLPQRPHSAVEGKTSDAKSLKQGRTIELMKKVQNLHKEVDERLKSDKNKTHSVTSSLSDLFEMANKDSDDESSGLLSRLKASRKQGNYSASDADTRNKAKIVIRKKNIHGAELEIDSGSERDRFSSASERIISTSTPRKKDAMTVSRELQSKPSRDYSEENDYCQQSSRHTSKLRRYVSSSNSEEIDSDTLHINDKKHHETDTDTANGRSQSPTKSRALSEKLRKILYSGSGSSYSPRTRYDNDSLSDRSRKERERDREGFDDDKDEDDTVNEEFYSRGNVRTVSSEFLAAGRREEKGRAISPFIKRLAYVDISSQEGTRRQPFDIHKLSSGRGSPADVLMGYLDNHNTVRLLQKLYQADAIDREIIMMKVLYFKAWLHFSTTAKQKRLRKQALMECADTFCYQRILALHFIVWERNARYALNVRRASGLCRRHMLSKGFRALRWSVSHSRHCKELIQTKYRMLTTRTSFGIWRNKAVKQRRERMEHTWQRWTQFVTEVHKIRHMQEVMDRNITEKVYTQWKKCYDKHMKQRMAFNYFRHTLYKHTFHTWSAYVYTCKQKKEKYLSAVSQYQSNLVKTTFFQIVFAFKKSKKARNHFRKQKLNEVFWSWKQASHVCRGERQQDLVVSVEHHQVLAMKNGFRKWKQKMMIRKADAHANSHLHRNFFKRWIQSYHEQFTRRQEMEAALETRKLHRALLTWRRNVVQIQRRHKKAVVLIERCLIRSTLKIWKSYVGTKIGLGQKVLLHQRNREKKSVQSWFRLWFDKYTERLDNKKRQLLWSHSCARKLFKKWRHICHQRSLERKLEESQPDRELRFMHTMFTRWLTSLEKRRAEEEEAEHMRKSLEQRNLQKYLQSWREATQKQLTIKPLIRQRGQKIVESCFQGWRRYIRSNVDCRKSKEEFLKIRIRKCFTLWRRQHVAHQVEKRIKSQFSQGLLLCCFEEWKLFVQLKRRGHDFRQRRLVTKTFVFWKNASSCQVSKRIMLKEEESNNLDLKRKTFVSWWEYVQHEKVTTEVCVTRLAHARGMGIVAHAFVEWKRLLHSTLIARAYQKMFNQRLVLTMLFEWRSQVVNDVHSAVGVFQEKIGMADCPDGTDGARTQQQQAYRLSSTLKEGWHNTPELEAEFEGSIPEDENMKMSVNASLSSSFTAGLFTRLLNENSSIDSDTDRSFLLSGGLQDAALSHQTRCNRMKEIATNAIWRLRHWPICVAFQQWQEFAGRQIQLKKAASQVRTVVDNLETVLAFRQWRVAFAKMKKSRQYWDYHLTSSTFAILRQNTQRSRHVKQLASRSQRHLKLKVFSQYFPIWLRKTQKQRREKDAVTLWTSSTAEEIELFPLENRLTQKLHTRTLGLCFSLWLLKFTHIQKIRHVYHTNTLQWVFTSWHEWASYRQSLVKKYVAMACERRTRMAFKKWCEKYRQSKQTAVLYQQAWQNYQTHILIVWHKWAKASHQRRNLYESFKSHNYRMKLLSSFTTWKSLTSKATTIQNRQRVFHLRNTFQDWCRFVQESKAKKQMTMQFQIRSYTLLVKRLFQHWHSAMVHQRAVHEERTQVAERKALHFGRVWRKKCQTRRGKQMEKMFQYRKLSIYLQTWQLRYASIQLLHERLGDWEKRKTTSLMRGYLQSWQLALKGTQMGRDYTGKLLQTVVFEWRVFTKESRDRRKRGLALTKALQERSLHVYFQFWVAITKVKMSVRYNAETRLQIKIMRAWHQYARNKRYLTELQNHFTNRVHTRLLTDAFSKLRWRMEYCSHLQEVADKIVQDRVRATLTAVVVLWRQRRDNILAARCYGGILVVRVVRQWRRFVHRRKTEREKELANQLAAVHFDQKQICKRALGAFKELALVSKMAAKRRQRLCDKYAVVWKTRVDLQITAMEMEWDMLMWRTWRRWRREFVQKQSARKMERDNKRHMVAQAFKSWRRLCKPSKEDSFYESITTPRTSGERRVSASTSLLPVPKGRASSSSTSPSAFNRLT